MLNPEDKNRFPSVVDSVSHKVRRHWHGSRISIFDNSDQITAHLCVEYFTIGHPPVFDTTDPVLLGLGWGVIATWWVGLILGVLLAAAARAGRWPPMGIAELYRPLAITLLIIGAIAAVAGVIGHVAAARGWVYLIGPIAERVPPAKHLAFLTDLWIHLASYIGGGVVGAGLCVRVLLRRKFVDRAFA